MKYFLLLLFMLMPLTAQAQQGSDSTPTLVNISNMFEGVKKYHQPAIYNKWWKETIKCAGKNLSKRERRGIQFRYVFGDMFVLDEKYGPFLGYSAPWDQTVLITIGNILDEKVVKHEMMHIILYHNAIIGDHPPQYFERCKLIVNR